MEHLDQLATEAANPRTTHIDELDTLELVWLINAEDCAVAPAVGRAAEPIARAVDAIAAAFRQGGRLVYLGAGTSGRLGILDASECPPTYGVDEGLVVGLIAGGKPAIFRAQEGAEDDPALAVADLKELNFNQKDVLVGIAASGRTPYVLGGLRYARELGAVAVSVDCTPASAIAAAADIAISVQPGPEVVTGSTRMKAGTAQKLVLNMLSTGAMIRIGKVYGNRMVDLKATNEKLRHRARRIVAETAGVDADTAQAALDAANGHAKTAICALLTGLSAEEARELLAANDGLLSKAIAAGRK